MRKQRITFCMMTLNNFDQAFEAIKRIKPYVDRVVVVDGGSVDGTIPALRAWDGVEFHVHPWTADDFAKQKNITLSHCAENGGADFILFMDPDEWIPEVTGKNLQKIIEECSGGYPERLSLIRLRARDVELSGTTIISNRNTGFFKPLFFRHHPYNRYVGHIHENLTLGVRGLDVQTMYEYYHIKEQNAVKISGTRNLFIGGGDITDAGKGDRYTLKWIEFRKFVREVTGIELWGDFNKYLIMGNIDPKIKDLIIKNRDEGKVDYYEGSTNWLDIYATYFKIYHPEEELKEFAVDIYNHALKVWREEQEEKKCQKK